MSRFWQLVAFGACMVTVGFLVGYNSRGVSRTSPWPLLAQLSETTTATSTTTNTTTTSATTCTTPNWRSMNPQSNLLPPTPKRSSVTTQGSGGKSKYTRHFCTDYPMQENGMQSLKEKGAYCKLTNFCVTHNAELIYFSDDHGGLQRDRKGPMFSENFSGSWHSSAMRMSYWAHDKYTVPVRFKSSPVPEPGPGVLWEENLAVIAKSAAWGNTMDCLVNGLVPFFYLLQTFGLQDEPFVMTYMDEGGGWCGAKNGWKPPPCCSAQSVCWEMYNMFSPCSPMCPWDSAKRLVNPYLKSMPQVDSPSLLCFRKGVIGLGYLGSKIPEKYAPMGRLSLSFLPFRNWFARRVGLDASLAVAPGEPIQLAWLERGGRSRKIVNRDDVRQQVMDRFGIQFFFYEMESLSFLERFKLLTDSNVCVSTFGTHFAFAILMRKGSVRVILAWNGNYLNSPDMRTTQRFISHISMVVVPPAAFKESKFLGEGYPPGTDDNAKAWGNWEQGRKHTERNIALNVSDISPALEEAFDQIREGFI